MMHDLINDAIVHIKNCERVGKGECRVRPASKLLIDILRIFQREGYIGEFELIEDGRGDSIRVGLGRKINNCGVIHPRFPVKHSDFVEWEKRYLPARDFGILVVTTPKGVMSHKDAKVQGTGGRLIAYIY